MKSFKNFDNLVDYINHINMNHKVKALWVHSSYYTKILSQMNDRLCSSHAKKGYDKLNMGSYTIDFQIVSIMNRDFCIVTEDMLKMTEEDIHWSA